MTGRRWDDPSPRRSPSRPAYLFLGSGLALTVLYLLLPAGSLPQMAVSGLLPAVVAVLLGVRVLRTSMRREWPWVTLAASFGLYAVASIPWSFWQFVTGRPLPFPSLLDGVYWLSYLGMAGFLVGISRAHSLRDRGIAVDALIVSIAAGTLLWEFQLEPTVTAPGIPLDVMIGAATYPLLLLVLLFLAARVALVGRRLQPQYVLLVAWIGLELAADLVYGVTSARGTFTYGAPWSALWVASYTALGTLSLHPAARRVMSAEDEVREPNWLVTLPLLSMCAVVPTAVMAFRQSEPMAESVALVLVEAVLVALLVFRVGVLLRDVGTERRLRQELEVAAERLGQAALTDSLTGLPNRAAFDRAMEERLASEAAEGVCCTIMLIDLDSFKAVNDRYGHRVGDQLLQLVAARLRATARASDVAARLGGDEFGLLAKHTGEPAARALAHRLVEALSETAEFDGATISPRVSVGLYLIEPDLGMTESLVRADAAMYAAKAAGGGFQVYDPARHSGFLARHQLELDLRAAPARGELVLFYQPVVELSTRRILGAEALLRWNHPTLGFLSPAAFMTVAEESGAILEVGRWVLAQGCTDAQIIRGHLVGDDFQMAVNLSRRQLYSDTIVRDVTEALSRTGLPAAALTLEVTETALMTESSNMLIVLDELKSLGVELAMDDFGTGYSSLAQLRALPIDVLKVDKAFVDGIAREEEEWSLAAAIIRLARSLGKYTLAEGVEHPAQLAHLRSLGCDAAQGYLFARPMPLADLLGFLDARAEADESRSQQSR